MPLNFAFTTVQVLWTLTFAAHLVLLVVLMGRDRARRFPFFTTGIALAALRLISSRLLYGRLPQLTMSEIFIALADVSAVVGLLVVGEVARRAFGGVQRRTLIAWTLALIVLGALVLGFWGPWPAWKTLTAGSLLSTLQLMQLLAQKTGLLVDVLTIALGVLVLLFGRRYGAGWRSHAQQLIIGLSTASLGQLAVQAIWEVIAKTAVPHSMAEYERILGLREKLLNGNNVVYLLVLVWWIVCLWLNEPSKKQEAEAASAAAQAPAAELPKDAQK